MVTRGPLFYTTGVSAMSSVQECIGLLGKHGATAIHIELADGKTTGLAFQIETPDGPRAYRMPVNVDGAYKSLEKARRERRIEPRYVTREQAEQTAWRTLRAWLESKLALIEAGMADLERALFGYLQVSRDQTIYDTYVEAGRQLAIGGGGQ